MLSVFLLRDLGSVTFVTPEPHPNVYYPLNMMGMICMCLYHVSGIWIECTYTSYSEVNLYSVHLRAQSCVNREGGP